MEKLTIALYFETNNNDGKSFRGYQNCLMISREHEETNTSGRAWLLPRDNEIVHAQAHAHKSTCMGVCECVQDKKKKKSLSKELGLYTENIL